MGKIKTQFISFESGRVTDADYIFVTRVGNRERGDVPSLTNSGDGFLLAEDFDGNRIVVDCRSVPMARFESDDLSRFDRSGMDNVEIVRELFENGLGGSVEFTDRAYIMVIDPLGNPMPWVFTDYDDAVWFLENEKAEA